MTDTASLRPVQFRVGVPGPPGRDGNQVPPYAVADLPSAAVSGVGFMVFATDGNGGAGCNLISDGVTWRRVSEDGITSYGPFSGALTLSPILSTSTHKFSSVTGNVAITLSEDNAYVGCEFVINAPPVLNGFTFAVGSYRLLDKQWMVFTYDGSEFVPTQNGLLPFPVISGYSDIVLEAISGSSDGNVLVRGYSGITLDAIGDSASGSVPGHGTSNLSLDAVTGSFNGTSLSSASARFGARTDGIVVDFTDDAFFGSTGFHGSAKVKDTTTPANNYDGIPLGLLTYTSPSLKLTRGPTGLYRYQAHNLFLNSAAPVTQSIAVVTNATYTVSLTGSGSVVLSGAATGTVTAGSPVSFKATTTPLVCTVSGSPTTVQVRRTPSDAAYIQTAGAAKFDFPYEWDSFGNLQGILVEAAKSNLALWGSDFTNAAWVKSNGTDIVAAKTATGPDGVANSASTLTAAVGGGTVLQAITSASSARISCAFVKRRTGTGTVEMTQDGGSTWTALSLTNQWQYLSVPAQTLTNPTVGFRLGTSGDAIDVWCFGQSTSTIVSSPIETFGALQIRAGDNITKLVAGGFPVSATGLSLGGCFETSKLASGTIALELQAAVRTNSVDGFTVATGACTFTDFDASVTQATMAHTPLTTGEFTRINASAATNDIRSYRDDEPSGQNPDTLATFQSSPFTQLNIGHSGTGVANHEGHISEIYYFPQVSTNDELRALNIPVSTAELLKSPHLLGDSFLNGVALESYLRKSLTTVKRSWTKDGVGGSSLVQQSARFDLTPWHYGQTLIIVDGGSTDSLADAQASIQTMIGHLTHSRWLFVEGGYDLATRATGSAARLVIDSINAWVQSAYPGHFVATKAAMQARAITNTGASGYANDQLDLAGDVNPRSLTLNGTDGLHPSTVANVGIGQPLAGNDVFSQCIVDAISSHGW